MIGLHSRQVNFKEIFSETSLKFNINPYFTVTQMIETLRPHLSTQFGINQDDIEIIVSGQYEPGRPAEAAPALRPSNIKLCNIWGPDLQNLSFYIRRKNYSYPQLEALRTNIEDRYLNLLSSSDNSGDGFNGQCPICLNITNLERCFECDHGVCLRCFNICLDYSIRHCSLCRASQST
jgi:hypothetical protein